ncbi:Aspyridones cluster regulator [Apiospora arundinis]|uniref:Aspyridones cluster regulator n=1 Tax=Apiospora arundinis TaxID=335852 RepID=A0ABR2JNF6_9PEZI
MFQVLRQADQRDGTSILESATPRGGQTATTRLACVRCREKKVRCTGDRDSCQRCKDKKVPCSYVAATRPEMSPRSSADAPATTASPAESTNLNPPPGEPQQPTSNLPAVTLPNTTSQTTLSEAASGTFSFACDDAIETYDFDQEMSQFVSMDDDAFEALAMTTSNTGSSFEFFESHLHDPLLDILGSDGRPDSSHLSSMSPDQRSSESRGGRDEQHMSCHSSHDMLRTFEAVEVSLMWTQRGSCAAVSPPLGLEEMLTCQKEVLDSCRARLGCTTCRLESYDAMILINICQKLLGSMVKVQAAIKGQRGREPTSTPSSLRASSLLDSSSAGPYSLVEQIMFSNNPGRKPQHHHEAQSRNGLGRQHSKSFGTGLSEWRFDEEDKLHALLSLLGIRMGKLKHVVQALEEIARSNRWLVHTSMAQHLGAQVSKHQVGIFSM